MALEHKFDCTSGARAGSHERPANLCDQRRNNRRLYADAWNRAGIDRAGVCRRASDDRPGHRLSRDSGSLHSLEFTASRWRQSTVAFSGCGKRSSVAWGGVSNSDKLCAVYFVHWAGSAPDHPAHVDLIVGPWGEDGSAAERRLLALRYLPRPNGGELVVIDGASRPAASSALCAHVFTADTFAAAPDAGRIQAMLAALWMNEPAVAELRALDAMSEPHIAS